MQKVVDKLRADFALVALQHRQSGAWGAEDEAQVGHTIAKAVQRDDEGAVLTWARWMAAKASEALLDWPLVGAKPEVRECADCQHFARPGRSDGYCHGREDLARAYGPDHPFRVLPADGGASCVRFVRAD